MLKETVYNREKRLKLIYNATKLLFKQSILESQVKVGKKNFELKNGRS